MSVEASGMMQMSCALASLECHEQAFVGCQRGSTTLSLFSALTMGTSGRLPLCEAASDVRGSARRVRKLRRELAVFAKAGLVKEAAAFLHDIEKEQAGLKEEDCFLFLQACLEAGDVLTAIRMVSAMEMLTDIASVSQLGDGVNRPPRPTSAHYAVVLSLLAKSGFNDLAKLLLAQAEEAMVPLEQLVRGNLCGCLSSSTRHVMMAASSAQQQHNSGLHATAEEGKAHVKDGGTKIGYATNRP
jgi:hypothetical protein